MAFVEQMHLWPGEDAEVPTFTIADDDDDDDTGQDYVRELSAGEVRDLQEVFERRNTGPHSIHPVLRTPKVVDSVTGPYDVVYHVGDSVELSEHHGGDFLRIKRILLLEGGPVLEGVLLRRARRANGMFPKTLNELYAVLHVLKEDVHDEAGSSGFDSANPAVDSCIISRPLAAVVQKREIVFTNAEFPEFSFRMSRSPTANPRELRAIEETGVLVCRTKHILYCSLKNGKVTEGGNPLLLAHEADTGKSVNDAGKKRRWRREDTNKAINMNTTHVHESFAVRPAATHTTYVDRTDDGEPRADRKRAAPQSSSTNDRSNTQYGYKRCRTVTDASQGDGTQGSGHNTQTHSLDIRRFVHVQKNRVSSKTSSSNEHSATRVYTFADICSGAGGSARGGVMAGLRLRYCVDSCAAAVETLERNFRTTTRLLRNKIYDFITRLDSDSWVQVDVLHISFPCQTYSSAYTRIGKNHDANVATGYSVIELLRKIRPRVVTLEQTSGLLERHPASFNALLHQFYSVGYSVHWKILNCADFGNVQPRRRLFLIASCPGEPLPPFPEPTHGNDPGLRPYVTIADRLALMPYDIEAHMHQYSEKDAAPYDPRRPLRQAITCNGGEGDIHPSGKRSFNMQELALLAGFPPHHKFASLDKTSIRKQIGNAVPSMVAKLIFKEVIKSLKAEDARNQGWNSDDSHTLIE